MLVRILVCITLTTIWLGECLAQVVQRPTVRQFQVATSVLVPDNGAAGLGGVTTARQSSVSRAVPGVGRVPMLGRAFRQQAIAGQISRSQGFVRAEVIDLDAMDAVMRRSAFVHGSPRFPAEMRLSETERRAQFLSRHVQRRPAASLQR